MWTRFMDMHSGGGMKEPPYEYIFIEAPEDEAKVIFYNRFGHNPERVTCTCCGDDYSISENKTIKEATAYDRGCRWDKKKKGCVEKADKERTWNKYMTVEQYKKNENVLFIYVKDIKPSERDGKVPVQGYVWM